MRVENRIAPPHTFVLIFGAILATLAAVLIGNAGDTRTASAQAPTSYDLCDRTAVVRHEILKALQYPGRNSANDNYGSISSAYPQSTWGTADTTSSLNSPASYTSDPCSTSGATLTITATNLAAHANWQGWRKTLRLDSSGLTELKVADFAGLTNLENIVISGNSISSIPDNIFQGNGIKNIQSLSGNRGLAPSCKWFGTDGPTLLEMRLQLSEASYRDIPYDAFDGCADMTQTAAADRSKLTILDLRKQAELGHVNIRWFARLTNLDRIMARGSYVDTWYYEDGDGIRYTDGAKGTAGVNDYSHVGNWNTHAKAIATAIKAEIDRAFGSTVPTSTADIGRASAGDGRFGRPEPGYNLCDPLDRPGKISSEIMKEMIADTPAKYGEAGSYRGPDNQYLGFGCSASATDSGVVYKLHLGTDAHWNFSSGNRKRFDATNSGLTEVKVAYFKGLRNLGRLDLGNNAIASIDDNAFAGLGVNELKLGRNDLGGNTINPSDWFNDTCGGMYNLQLDNNRITYADIPFDAFDCFGSDIWGVSLTGNPLKHVNLRWFSRLRNSRWGINMSNSPVISYWDENNNAVPASPTDYWSTETMRTDMRTAHTTYLATQSWTIRNTVFTTGNFRGPALALDICDRPKPIWADFMRELGYIDDEFPSRDIQASWVGDIRHARWAHLADPTYNAQGVQTAASADCFVMPATAIVKEDMSFVDRSTTTFDDSIHEKAIYHSSQFWSNGDSHLDLNFSGGKGLVNASGALNPAHFKNFQFVSRIYLRDAGIRSIPPNTFENAYSLRHLFLNNNALDDADFAGTNFLSPLSQLEQLDLSGNGLTSFLSSWLHPDVRDAENSTLGVLRLSYNPIRTLDMSGLTRLHQLRISDTQITSVDPALFEMSRMRWLYWESDSMTLEGLHPNGVDAFFNAMPKSVANSLPPKSLGNANHFEDAVLDANTLAASIAHHEWLKAINDAHPVDASVQAISLNDPCRPNVQNIGSLASWSSDYGPLCLTESQKNSFISSVTDFNGVGWVLLQNANLSDAQMGTLLDNMSNNSIWRMDFTSNPDAFGADFDSSKLSNFNNHRWTAMWQLRLVNTDITFSQVDTILRNLQRGAYSRRETIVGDNVLSRTYGLDTIDLSYNDGLFTGVETSDVEGLLSGVTKVGGFVPALTLQLSATDLNFDQLKAIIDSIDTHRETKTENAARVRSLSVADNPHLWDRWNATTEMWDDVPESEIRALMGRLKGLASLNIGGTGLTAEELTDIMDELSSDPGFDPGIDAALSRLAQLSVRGVDLSGSTTLTADFAKFAPTLSTRRAGLTILNLADTSITAANLDDIADGLQTAGALSTIRHLNLRDNPDLADGCDPDAASDALKDVLARFTNLRSVNLQGSIASFPQLRCFVVGLDAADGDSENGAPLLGKVDFSNNPNAFTVPASGDDEEAPATPADVAMVFGQLPNAKKALQNTGLTLPQASAALQAQLVGLTDIQQRSITRSFAVQNAAFEFRTPLPEDVTVQSGRGSLRVRFDHNPMRDGEPINVLRYEFRYRVRPADLNAPWGDSASEAWRTATLDLSTTGVKMFEIYGLEPETIYQVQLRASSLGLPATTESVGGTWTSLPEINEIKPAITEVSVRAGDLIRLEVDVYGLANIMDNTLPDKDGSKLIFNWSDDPSGGDFAAPNDVRRVMYTAPSLPGTYTLMAEAQPDGICTDHHKTTFDISAEDRAKCQATFTVRVSRAPVDIGPPPEPVNPAGLIPTSLTDAAGVAYAVFTPVEGGTFSGDGVTVTAPKGAIPDQQLLGVAATVSPIAVPEPTPGTKLTLSGRFYDINGVQRTGDAPVSGYALDDPLSVCLPLPAMFRANVSDIVIVNRSSDGALGILSSTLRQSGGALTVCGNIGQLPATVAVAKMGVVEEPVVQGPNGAEPPPTGGASPANAWVIWVMLAAMAATVLGGVLARGAPRERV